MKKNILSIIILTAAIALFVPGLASAQAVLYGIDAQGSLFTVNTTTGTGTLVGAVPANCGGYNEIVIDNTTGRAWAQERNGCFRIQEFDLATGALIGGAIGDAASWHGLEFVNGTLYGAGFAGPWPGGVPLLATLDPTTGAYAIIGEFALPSGVVTGIAYDTRSHVLYGIDGGGGGSVSESTLYVINMGTGVATPIGLTGMTAGSLSFGPDGELYAGGVGGDQGNLFRINQSTGAGTLVGATGFGTGGGNGISGLALFGTLPAAVPTTSTPALALLFVLIAAVGVIALRS